MKWIGVILLTTILIGTAYAKTGFDFGLSLGSGSVTVGPPSESVSKEDGTNATKEDGTDWLKEG